MSRRRKGITYKKQARQMIHHVYNFMKAEAEANNLKVTNKSLEQKTADSTKIPIYIVHGIVSDARTDSESAENIITGSKRPRTASNRNLSPLQQGQIKRLIHNYHVVENDMVTMDRLMRKLAETMDYKGSTRSLRRTIVKELGFRFINVECGKKLLLEKSDIRLQRIEYLQNLRNYRQADRNIVYAHHAFLELNHCTSLALSKRSVEAVKTYMGVFTASTDTYIPGATYVFGTSKAHYDEHFYINYTKWIKEHLIPNLPENSVVVISNEKYHNKESEVTPNAYSTRIELTKWLTAKNIKFEPNWLKPQLYSLIKAYRTENKQFLIDKLLADNNHTLLKLPFFHPDLNPVEIAWSDIKSYVKTKEMQFTVSNVNNAVQEKIGMMAEDFKTLCRKVKDIEQEYRKSDYVIDMLTEEFKFNGGESSDQDGDADEEESDDEEIEVKKERLE